MIVCLCNSIRDKDIEACAAMGCRSVSGVFRQYACKPQCGQCVPYVKEQVSSFQPGK